MADDDNIEPIERDGKACCLCGWALPTTDVSFYAPFEGRYMITVHCPHCNRLWDGKSHDRSTIYEHPLNRVGRN